MTTHTFIQWFWIASVCALGVYFLLRPSVVVSLRRIFDGMTTDVLAQSRLDAAVERRQRAEGLSPALGRMTGMLFIAWSLLGLFTKVPLTVAYALLCVMLCAMAGIGYLRLQSVHQKRVASLEVRTPFTAVPSYWYGLAVAAAAMPLADLGVPALRPAAIAVSLCALALTLLAWRLATAPAFVSDDAAVEAFVDDRLRLVRAGNALVFAVLIVFVYLTQTLPGPPAHVYLVFAGCALWLAIFAAFTARKQESPPAQEVERW